MTDLTSLVAARSRLTCDLRVAVTTYDVVLAALRYDHGHGGHEQRCSTCVRRARVVARCLAGEKVM